MRLNWINVKMAEGWKRDYLIKIPQMGEEILLQNMKARARQIDGKAKLLFTMKTSMTL